MKITVVGAGPVGLAAAALLARRHEVVLLDIDAVVALRERPAALDARHLAGLQSAGGPVVANRLEPALADVLEKVYSRDVLGKDT